MQPLAKRNTGFLLFPLLVLLGCSPKVSPSAADNTLKPLGEDAEVLVVNLNQPLPDGCKPIGKIKADSGGTECHYSTVVANAQSLARGMGGNVIKVTRYRMPGDGGPCYQIKADVFYAANADQLVAADRRGRTPCTEQSLASTRSTPFYMPTGQAALERSSGTTCISATALSAG